MFVIFNILRGGADVYLEYIERMVAWLEGPSA